MMGFSATSQWKVSAARATSTLGFNCVLNGQRLLKYPLSKKVGHAKIYDILFRAKNKERERERKKDREREKDRQNKKNMTRNRKLHNACWL